MAEEIAFKNGRIANCEGLVTLTLDRVILHTVVHHSSTSTYMPNLIEIDKLLVDDGRMHVCTYGRMDRQTFETGFIRSTLRQSLPNNNNNCYYYKKSASMYFS